MKNLPTYDEFLNEDLDYQDLKRLEDYADKLFAIIGLDVEFSRHFKDRVNDPRNGKPITFSELKDLFSKTFKKHASSIANAQLDFNAVIKDMSTDINTPFAIDMNNGGYELVMKTAMRKKNFQTSNRIFKV